MGCKNGKQRWLHHSIKSNDIYNFIDYEIYEIIATWLIVFILGVYPAIWYPNYVQLFFLITQDEDTRVVQEHNMIGFNDFLRGVFHKTQFFTCTEFVSFEFILLLFASTRLV